jgi:hypothetical protein
MIAEVVSEGSNVAVDACPLVDDISKFPYLPPRGVYHIGVVKSFASTK